jgi:hypothetical protein
MRGYKKKKSERSQINSLIHLKLLEKQEQDKLQISRWKKIIKISMEINEMETKKKTV